jgi:hypothetical protein
MADHPDPTERTAPQEWLDALARSEADVAAGRTVPWTEARARLLAIMDETEIEPTDLGA